MVGVAELRHTRHYFINSLAIFTITDMNICASTERYQGVCNSGRNDWFVEYDNLDTSKTCEPLGPRTLTVSSPEPAPAVSTTNCPWNVDRRPFSTPGP